MPQAAGPLQLPECAAQRFDFLLVAGFLPLGQFGQFEHVFHLIERALERLDDLRDFVNRLTDGGDLRPARNRHLTGDFGDRFEQGGRFGCRFHARYRGRNQWQRRMTNPAATATTTTTATPATIWAGNRFDFSAFWHDWANDAPDIQN